jgi:hypothetical protein
VLTGERIKTPSVFAPFVPFAAISLGLRAAIALLPLLTPALAAGCTSGIYFTAATFAGDIPDDLVRRLNDARIDHVYVYRLDVSSAAQRAKIQRAIVSFREKKPGAKLIGMIGKIAGPATTLGRARELWGLGFDGVQLDFEPVRSGDANLPAVLKLLREEKPAGKLVGLAGYMIEDDSLPAAGGKRLLVWEEEYYRELVTLVDDLMVMNYDTAIFERDDYVRATSIQTRRLADLAGASGVRMNIGVITDVQGRRGMFDRKAENFSSGLEGVRNVWPACTGNRGITLFTADGMTEDYWRELAGWVRQ